MTMLARDKKDCSRRKSTGGGRRPDLRNIRREEASARQASWSLLSAEKQLAELDRRLGKGIGAVKQRARLAVRVERTKMVTTNQQPTKSSRSR